MNKLEHIIKAGHSIQFCISDLQAALSTSSELESIIILDLIENAAKLQTRLNHLEKALQANQREAIA